MENSKPQAIADFELILRRDAEGVQDTSLSFRSVLIPSRFDFSGSIRRAVIIGSLFIGLLLIWPY